MKPSFIKMSSNMYRQDGRSQWRVGSTVVDCSLPVGGVAGLNPLRFIEFFVA